LGKAWEIEIEPHQIFIDFQNTYDSIRRDKLYEIMKLFGIPNSKVNKSNNEFLDLPCEARSNDD
jgi:hypothetical protein